MNTVEQNNPLLERLRIPGETHRLPSRGVFYKNNELDASVTSGEVQVFPMVSIDEITLRSPDLLLSGDAIKQVIRRCCPQVQHPEKLFQKDIDFLMVVLRKVSYGPNFEIEYQHNCKDAKSHTYIVDLDAMVRSTKSVDPITIGEQFTVVMPNNQQVKLLPMRFESTLKLLQTTDKDLTVEKRRGMLVDILLDLIALVDEIADKKMIEEWLKTIPAGWSNDIERVIDQSQHNWGVSSVVDLKCKDCQEIIDVNLPINPLTFFI